MNRPARPRLTTWLIMAGGLAVLAAVILLEDLAGNQLNRLLLYLPGIDKVLHVAQSFVIFCVLYVVGGRLRLPSAVRLAVALAGTLGLALFDEWQQQWAAERNVELGDLQAGLAGALLAIAAVTMSTRRAIATAIAVAAIAIGGQTAYASYARTKDFNRGILLSARREFNGARDSFLKAIEAGNSSASLYNELAWAEVNAVGGSAAQAVKYAEQSLKLNPDNADALDTYGWALQSAGRAQDAMGPLTLALEKKPKMYCIHYHLGATLLALGETDRARQHLQKQIALEPWTVEAVLAEELLRKMPDGER